MQSLLLPFVLPDLNTLIAARGKVWRGKRGNAYNDLKQKSGKQIQLEIVSQKLVTAKSAQHFLAIWFAPNRRKDPDNIAGGGRKIILDALVNAAVLPDDSWKWVASWTDIFTLDPDGNGAVILFLNDFVISPDFACSALQKNRAEKTVSNSATQPNHQIIGKVLDFRTLKSRARRANRTGRCKP